MVAACTVALNLTVPVELFPRPALPTKHTLSNSPGAAARKGGTEPQQAAHALRGFAALEMRQQTLMKGHKENIPLLK